MYKSFLLSFCSLSVKGQTFKTRQLHIYYEDANRLKSKLRSAEQISSKSKSDSEILIVKISSVKTNAKRWYSQSLKNQNLSNDHLLLILTNVGFLVGICLFGCVFTDGSTS